MIYVHHVQLLGCGYIVFICLFVCCLISCFVVIFRADADGVGDRRRESVLGGAERWPRQNEHHVKQIYCIRF